MIREDTYLLGGENKTQVNVIHQKKMKPGPDLRKELLEMLSDYSGDTLTPEKKKDETPDEYVVNTLEEAIRFFTGTINLAFGSGEYTSNEVADFLLTSEDSTSSYETTNGGMFLFKYEPTTKNKLKYYDTLPLIINLGSSSDGLIGLNLHYLPNRYRVAFMRAMFGNLDIDEIDEDDVQGRLSRISTYKFIKPTYKRYKYDGISSRLIRIPVENWLLASLLPISKFEKSSRKDVWNDSIKIINNEERRI